MRISLVLACVTTGMAACIFSQASAETVQTAANVFEGRPFLWVEAESFSSLADGGTTGNGWKVVTKETPINSSQGVPILPATSNVSGTALLDDVGGGGHEDTALYEVKFITPGAYQLFTRHSMYDSDGNNNVGNEDSVYLSPAFNKNSAGDWVGFEGLDFDENDISGNVDVPNPGYAADPDGWKPSTADSTNDGWYALRDWGVKSMGSVDLSNLADSGLFNGNFNWYNRPFFVGATPGGGFASDFGFKTEYTVTEEMVGQTLSFEMGNREPYGVFDGFLFIQTSNIYPNMDLLDIYSQEDLDEGILPKPVSGDYNDNGIVDAADYVLWRKGGPLQNDETPGTLPEDYDVWRMNFGRTSGSGAALNPSTVPEPSALIMFAILSAAIPATRQRRRD
jgi:hypothetical protein